MCLPDPTFMARTRAPQSGGPTTEFSPGVPVTQGAGPARADQSPSTTLLNRGA